MVSPLLRVMGTANAIAASNVTTCWLTMLVSLYQCLLAFFFLFVWFWFWRFVFQVTATATPWKLHQFHWRLYHCWPLNELMVSAQEVITGAPFRPIAVLCVICWFRLICFRLLRSRFMENCDGVMVVIHSRSWPSELVSAIEYRSVIARQLNMKWTRTCHHCFFLLSS